MTDKTPSILHMRAPISDPPTTVRYGTYNPDRDRGIVDIAFVMDRYPEETKDLKFDQLAEFLRNKREQAHREERECRREIGSLEDLRRDADELRAFTAWYETGPAMQKPRESLFRKFRRAMIDGEVLQYGTKCESREFDHEVMRFVEPFVIEHDWSAALRAADGGDVRLPYDVCAFEFRYGDRPVLAIATQLESDIFFSMAVEMDRWVFCGCANTVHYTAPRTSDELNALHRQVSDQIRAVCIALDAEVAVSETVRVAHAGNGSSALRVPGKAYHVVSLSKRAARPTPLGGDPSGRRVRLHFRRGHWRHFEAHKTWIRWMLVGDPDLGFIEKHYTL